MDKDQTISQLQQQVASSNSLQQEIKQLRDEKKQLRAELKNKTEEARSLSKRLHQAITNLQNGNVTEIPKEQKPKTSVLLNSNLNDKQRMFLDPIGSVKRSVLAIIEHFDENVEAVQGDLEKIGDSANSTVLRKI